LTGATLNDLDLNADFRQAISMLNVSDIII